MNSGLWFILNLAINDSVMPMAMAQTACTRKKMPIDMANGPARNRLAIRAPYMANFIYPVERIGVTRAENVLNVIALFHGFFGDMPHEA